MATQFNLHSNIAEAKARKRNDELRAQAKFAEARGVLNPMGAGCAVLNDAHDADPSGEDGRFRPKPDKHF